MQPKCLKVIVDGERAGRYAAEHIVVNGSPLSFEFLRAEEKGPPADLILLAVKRHQLQQAIADLRNFVGGTPPFSCRSSTVSIVRK